MEIIYMWVLMQSYWVDKDLYNFIDVDYIWLGKSLIFVFYHDNNI